MPSRPPEPADLPGRVRQQVWGELVARRGWRAQVTFPTAGGVVLATLIWRSGTAGWLPASLFVLTVLAIYLAVTALRTRAGLAFEGPDLVVRSWRGTRRISAEQVSLVRGWQSAQGPDLKLVLTEGGRVLVPTAAFRQGHSATFGWLLSRHPRVPLDKAARRTLEAVLQRGLLDLEPVDRATAPKQLVEQGTDAATVSSNHSAGHRLPGDSSSTDTDLPPSIDLPDRDPEDAP